MVTYFEIRKEEALRHCFKQKALLPFAYRILFRIMLKFRSVQYRSTTIFELIMFHRLLIGAIRINNCYSFINMKPVFEEQYIPHFLCMKMLFYKLWKIKFWQSFLCTKKCVVLHQGGLYEKYLRAFMSFNFIANWEAKFSIIKNVCIAMYSTYYA